MKRYQKLAIWAAALLVLAGLFVPETLNGSPVAAILFSIFMTTGAFFGGWSIREEGRDR